MARQEFTVFIPEELQSRGAWNDQVFWDFLKHEFEDHPYAGFVIEKLREASRKSDADQISGVESIDLTPWRVNIKFISERNGQKSSRAITFGTDVVCVLLSRNNKYALVNQRRLFTRGEWELPRCIVGHDETHEDALKRLISTEIGLPWESISDLNESRMLDLDSGIAAYVRTHSVLTGSVIGNPEVQPKEGFTVEFFSMNEIIEHLKWGVICDPLLFSALFIKLHVF